MKNNPKNTQKNRPNSKPEKMSAREKERQRVLSPAESRRMQEFTRMEQKMRQDGYHKVDLTIGLVAANVAAIALSIPFLLVFGFGYYRLHGVLDLYYPWYKALAGFAILIALIFVHEGIHGITWAAFAKDGWKSISFGFIAEYLTPYCTCRDPLKKGQYIAGALMPGIVLGILPSLAGMLAGWLDVLVIGLLMTMSAGGDFMIVLKILAYKNPGKEILYADHPTQGGVVAFVR